jgi:hypothetical protein
MLFSFAHRIWPFLQVISVPHVNLRAKSQPQKQPPSPKTQSPKSPAEKYALQSHQTKRQQRHTSRLIATLDRRRPCPPRSLRHDASSQSCACYFLRQAKIRLPVLCISSRFRMRQQRGSIRDGFRGLGKRPGSVKGSRNESRARRKVLGSSRGPNWFGAGFVTRVGAKY